MPTIPATSHFTPCDSIVAPAPSNWLANRANFASSRSQRSNQADRTNWGRTDPMPATAATLVDTIRELALLPTGRQAELRELVTSLPPNADVATELLRSEERR